MKPNNIEIGNLVKVSLNNDSEKKYLAIIFGWVSGGKKVYRPSQKPEEFSHLICYFPKKSNLLELQPISEIDFVKKDSIFMDGNLAYITDEKWLIEKEDSSKISDELKSFGDKIKNFDEKESNDSHYNETLLSQTKNLIENLSDMFTINHGEKRGKQVGLEHIHLQNPVNTSKSQKFYEIKNNEIRALELFEREFMANARRDFFISEIKMKNFGGFDEFVYHPTSTINLILGKNGSKKTEFFRLLASFLYPKYFEKMREISKKEDWYFKIKGYLDNEKEVSKIYSHHSDTPEDAINIVSFLVIEDNRFSNYNTEIRYDKSSMESMLSSTIENFLTKKPSNEATDYIFNEIGNEIITFYTNIPEHSHIINKDNYTLFFDKFRLSDSFKNSLVYLLEKVLFELLKDEENIDNKSFFQFHSLKYKKTPSTSINIFISSEIKSEKKIEIQYISSGIFSILSIFGLIHCYLRGKYSQDNYLYKDDNLHDQPAVVFIDELDSHLHPTFQKKIIKILRESFPRIQFFLVANNPSTVMGCYKGEVAIMKKKENGRIVLEQYTQSTIGTQSSHLLSDLFETDDIDQTYIDLYFNHKNKKTL